jgi:hypothetical protein
MAHLLGLLAMVVLFILGPLISFLIARTEIQNDGFKLSCRLHDSSLIIRACCSCLYGDFPSLYQQVDGETSLPPLHIPLAVEIRLPHRR